MMLRPALTLLVATALAVPLILTFASADSGNPASTQSMSVGPSLPYSEIHLDSTLLPGATGWFAVPVTVDREAYVRVDVDTYAFEANGLTMGQIILAVEGREAFPFMTAGGFGNPSSLEVAHDGRSLLRCCDGLQTSWSSGSGGGGIPIRLSPGETLWVGLAAFGWDVDHQVFFTLSGQAFLQQGPEHTGDRVEAVDLAAEALRAGTSAHAFAYNVILASGAAERTWQAEGFGLFALDAFAWYDGEADARLVVELPGIPARETTIAGDGVYVRAHRAGTYRVMLDDLKTSALQQGEPIRAVAMFADIDIPGDAAFIYP